MHFDRLAYPGDYWRFSRQYAKLLQLIRLIQSIPIHRQDLSPEARKAVQHFFQLKKRRQEEIGRLLRPYTWLHEKCGGQCCQAPADWYFTVLDHWLNIIGTGTAAEFATSPYRSWYAINLRRINFIFSAGSAETKKAAAGSGCSHLGAAGCMLEFGARPVKCSVSSCLPLRLAMDHRTKLQFYRLNKDIYLISLSLFDILKREANFPRSYGSLSLLLTI